MSDTIPTVRWSLTGNPTEVEYFWLRPEREDLLANAVRRTGLESQLHAAFEVTNPLWYGLWIHSPLSAEQCQVLRILLTDVVAQSSRQAELLQGFLAALVRAETTGEGISVELSPPGHADLGWITTFAHCPRCKAEADLDRWQESYPTELMNCRVCGHAFSPAATHSMEPEYFAESVTCGQCQKVHPVKGFSAADIETLEQHNQFAQLTEEAGWLRRVAAFNLKYPAYRDRIKPHFELLLESDDPHVQEQLCQGLTFDEIALPKDGTVPIEQSRDWTSDELEVIDYLRHHSFAMPARMDGVHEALEQLRPIVASTGVPCPSCGARLAP